MAPFLGNRRWHGNHFVPLSRGVVSVLLYKYELDRITHTELSQFQFYLNTLRDLVTLTSDHET